MIVCPVTLINNWRKEIRKWLGNERIGVFVADSKANLRDFIAGKTYSVMIIGYEKVWYFVHHSITIWLTAAIAAKGPHGAQEGQH